MRQHFSRFSTLFLLLISLAGLPASQVLVDKNRHPTEALLKLEVHVDELRAIFIRAGTQVFVPTEQIDMGEISWDLGFDNAWYLARTAQQSLFVVWQAVDGRVYCEVFHFSHNFEVDLTKTFWIRKIQAVGEQNLVIFVEKEVLLAHEFAKQGKILEPAPAACEKAPPQQVRPGMLGYICTQIDGVYARPKPGKKNPIYTNLLPAERFLVVSGPVCKNNWSWWEVRTERGVVGWVPEGGDETDPYFICPIPDFAKSTTCPDAIAERLQVGQTVLICTTNAHLQLREAPGLASTRLALLDPHLKALVQSGPVCQDEHNWWKIETATGLTGWVAEGQGLVGEYYLCPESTPSPYPESHE